MGFFKTRIAYKPRLALHLPAHTRGSGLPPDLRFLLQTTPASWDLPELPNIGGPLESRGAINYSQQCMAERWGAYNCWYGVNGATSLLQVALLAIASPGNRVLMPRNVHRSIFSGCVLGQIKPVLFNLPFDPLTGLWKIPNPEDFKDILSKSGQIKAVVFLHPTYQGLTGNLTELIKISHTQGLTVLVDEAHGTHFAAAPEQLPPSALAAGADIVVNSLHKSGGGISQSAVLWLQNKRIDPIKIERALLWLQTSSPSAILLASIEASLDYLASSEGYTHLQYALDIGNKLYEELTTSGFPLVVNQDPLRLILNTAELGISGIEADLQLISQGLIAELPEPGCLTFCLGMSPSRRIINTMKPILESLKLNISSKPLEPFPTPPLPAITELELLPLDAWNSRKELIPLEDSCGRIAADIICPYPPGIPILFPGEMIDSVRALWLSKQHYFWPTQIANRIAVTVEQ